LGVKNIKLWRYDENISTISAVDKKYAQAEANVPIKAKLFNMKE
jgi:hypothetical protein